MRKFHVFCLIVFIISISFVPAQYAHADAFNKLGRGITNTITGWTEIFIEPGKKFDKNHNIAEGMTGVPVGIVKALTRTAAGAYEFITFPIPIPEDYDTIITPEYAWTSTSEGIDSLDPAEQQ